MKKSVTVLILLMVVCAVSADRIETTAGSINREVTGISAKALLLAGKKQIPLAKVQKVSFDRDPVPGKESGIVLRNGTRLHGVLREHGKEEIIFRSTTFGEMRLPSSELAGRFYVSGAGMPASAPSLLRRDGATLVGKILWADAKSAGVMTEQGLQRIPSEEIAMLAYAEVPAGAELVLRNGDEINATVIWQGAKGRLKIAEKEFDLAFTAVLRMEFKNESQ